VNMRIESASTNDLENICWKMQYIKRGTKQTALTLQPAGSKKIKLNYIVT